jgi:Flp pilus assembly protein TadD
LKPDYAEAHYNLSIMLQEQGKLEEAEASYRQVIALKADFAEAYYNLATLASRIRQIR